MEGWVAATTSDGLKLLRSLRSESRSKSDSGALRAGTGGCGRKERNTSHTHTHTHRSPHPTQTTNTHTLHNKQLLLEVNTVLTLKAFCGFCGRKNRRKEMSTKSYVITNITHHLCNHWSSRVGREFGRVHHRRLCVCGWAWRCECAVHSQVVYIACLMQLLLFVVCMLANRA